MVSRVNLSFYTLVLVIFIISLTMAALLLKASPLFSSRSLFLCQGYITSTMLEVPRLLPQALLLAVAITLGIGLSSFLIQLVKTRLFLNKLLTRKTDTPPHLAKVFKKLNLYDRVVLINDDNVFSFCSGIFYPRIVISTALVKALSVKELEAVLLHEQSHLKSHDPTKVLIGKTFSSMFFFLPILGELNKNAEAANELLADQWAISRQQTSLFLRQALKKILAQPQLRLAATSNVSDPDYFEIRVHRLINPAAKHHLGFSPISLLTTLLFVLISYFLLQTPISAFHKSNQLSSAYFLCSSDQPCSKQCSHNAQTLPDYAPTYQFLPSEKRCD